MRNLDAPVAASHRAYAITVGLQDEHGNPIAAVEVKFTGFATLGELLTVLEVVRTSDALLQAQAEVMSSTQEEFAENLAGLQQKAATQVVYPPPIPAELIIDDAGATPAPPTKEQIEQALLGTLPKYSAEDAINFRRYNSDGIEVDENGDPVPADLGALLDSVLHQFADGRGDESDSNDEDEPVDCYRCDGCGQLADSDDQEPWTAWTSLPPGSDLAVTAGLVKPVPCFVCDGAGVLPVPVSGPTG